MEVPAHLQKPPLHPEMPSTSFGGFKSVNACSQLWRFALATGVLVICFSAPLWELLRFAAGSELYSYILLIPFLSCYLLWLEWGSLPVSTKSARPIMIIFVLAGLVLTAAYWLGLRSSLQPFTDDYLAVMTICFLLFFYAICASFWGKETLRAAAFPLGFLIFLVPIPFTVVQQIDSFLQYGSAWMAAGFFWLSGTTFFRNGLLFQLPDIRLEIAPECSGIHSTLVLFITSLLASYIFLRKPWKRAFLTFFVIPLGLLRNGFRVFVIGQLCVHMGPQMINSYIHHKGGPIFFILSLIPLYLLLIVLQMSEKSGAKAGPETSKNSHA
jgi:exosortase C (VPDSG-CTERM-specific)